MPELYEMGMPRLGIAMSEGTVVRWLKQVGERIVPDEVLLVIENDKVEIDVVCPYDGTVVEILAAEGDVVPVMQTIARIAAD